MNRKENEKHNSLRISRSTKLRKYASVYKSYVRKNEQSKISKSPPRKREPSKSTRARRLSIEPRKEKGSKKEVPKSKRKSLNPYQKFVQQESKKDKYKDLPGKKRLGAIAIAWKTISK
jgi:hypothetical protein